MEFDISQRCAASLAGLAGKVGLDKRSEGDRIEINGRNLRLRGRVDNEAQTEESHLVGIVVDVFPDGSAHPISCGTVGFDESRGGALENAVSDWTQLVGVGLLAAISGTSEPGRSFTIGRLSVYPGATGIRGAQRVAWSRENHERRLSLLEPVLVRSSRSDGFPHSISIMFVPRQDSGECWIDGGLSEQALQAVREFPWPTPGRSYMFKQYYIFRIAPWPASVTGQESARRPAVRNQGSDLAPPAVFWFRGPSGRVP